MGYYYEEGWWETKEHRHIKICDMETSHIENTIKFLQRNKDFYDEIYFDGWTCDGDGDGQIYALEDNEHLVDKKIEELQYELDRRKK